MAPPKKSAATRAKAAAPAAPRAPRPAATSAAAPASGGDSNRLLREAAWSRMFGRTEKNPFTR